MVRAVLSFACLVLAACSFEIRAASDAASDGTADSSDRDDADLDAVALIDAPIDAAIDAPPACAAPFVPSVHGCHRFLQPATATFANGRIMCQAIGADLVIAPTMGESVYVATMSGITGPDARTLLGLSKVGNTWRWVDGTALVGAGLWTSPAEPEVGEDSAVLTPAGAWVGRNVGDTGFILACEK